MIPRPRLIYPAVRPLPPPCRAPFPPHRGFRASRALRDDDGMPNHYETLGLQPAATAQEIKKKFFSLSKIHHPDHNPNDPTASTRFMKISEAYGTLGSAEKRARYDRDFLRSQQHHHHHHHEGAHHRGGSYHSQPAGGRSPSGLSRRRSQFKGPPPSFYRNGGWGSQSAKRSEYASRPSHQHEAAGAEGTSAQDAPGTGPAGFAAGLNNDVPHFDQGAHFQRHENIQSLHQKARRKRSIMEDIAMETSGPSVLFNFFLLSGVLGVIFGVSALLRPATESRTSAKRRDG